MSALPHEQPIERILPLLDGVKQTGPSRWLARCPAHRDRAPSMSIREGEDGRVLLHDFAGCSVEDITNAVGLKVRDLFPARPGYLAGQRALEPRIPPADALRALALESSIVMIAAEDIAHGNVLSEIDRARLGTAARRIQAAREVTA